MTTKTGSALTGLLADLVREDRDSTAFYDVAGDDVLPLTRGEFARHVDAVRSELSAVGVLPGQCVAVMLPNWSDALVWQFAAVELGAHVIGINTRYNIAEVVHILEGARPVVVAVAAAFHGLDLVGTLRRAVADADADVPAVAVVAGPGAPAADPAGYDLGAGAWSAGSGSIRGAQASPTPDQAIVNVATRTDDSSDSLAVAFTTSGSTGTPKLAAHRDSAVVRHAHADAAAMGIGDGDIVLCVLPVSGVFGFNTALAALAGRGALLMEPVFDAAATLRRMDQLCVTHAVGGDDLFGRILDAWDPSSGVGPHALRWLGIADFLGRSSEVMRWVEREFGTFTTGVFGSSEVFALALLWTPDDPVEVRHQGGGRPVDAAMELRVVDAFDNSQVGTGQEGELQLRGHNVVDAYLGDSEAAARAFTSDGWFRTGDLVTATGDGGYVYVCRMGDALRLRGFLVDPAEIEQRLAAHAAVQTAKVVGVDGCNGHTEAVGFVVLNDANIDVDAASLTAWCRDALAGFKVPTAMHIIEKMPTTIGGNGTKIKAAELRELARLWMSTESDQKK